MSRGKARGRGGNRGRGGRGKGGGGSGRQVIDDRVSFENVVKTNEKMERYYNNLDIIPEGPDRDAFWAALRRELPNSFRFTGSRGHALRVRDILVERFFPVISQIEHEGKPVALPEVMPWYPEGLAYSMTTPKKIVRKYEPFKEFQRYLVSETGVGNISRQEAVSMIPPLVMDLKPEHVCLDLCAAPGSKTAQMIEMIHAGEEGRVAEAIAKARNQGSIADADRGADDGRTQGLLIANDANYKRAQLLTHQMKRLNSPNLIVTNHDATMYPSIELPTQLTPGQPRRGRWLKFDRILADVPCSGDGTCRKNPGIWKDWSPQNGLGLYITQVRILTRALQMLKVGGRVVYSTCSMNPVEDEAVVSSAIERCGGEARVRLIDCSDKLPGLVRSPGLLDWSIISRSGKIYESWPEAQQHDTPESKIVPGMFAPDPRENIPLQHCMRVYPHQQDTGGFFIAVLEKLKEINAKPEQECKCLDKDWSIDHVPQQTSTTTAFTELIDEVSTEPIDGHGHLHKLDSGPIAKTDTSPAERQNASLPADFAGSKRKPDEEIPGSDLGAKKPRVEDLVGEGQDNIHGSTPMSGLETAAKPEAVGSNMSGDISSNKRRRDQEAQVESFKYLSAHHPELQKIYEFYELNPSFPRDRFLVRNPAGDPVKGIYYSSQLIKDILVANEHRKMKFVHGGVKMFQKQDSQGQDICQWRVQTEGLPIIEGWVGESRVVRLQKKSTLRKLLTEMFLRVGKHDVDDGTGWKALAEIGAQVRDLGMGCCVLRVETSDDPDGFTEPLTLPLWKSLHSVNLMLPKDDRKAMLLRIYNEEVELINHSDQKGQQSGQPNGDGVAGAIAQQIGSVPAEDIAREVEQKIAAAGNDNDEDEDVLVAPNEAELDGQAMAMEADIIAAEDALESRSLETIEDDNNKITQTMPERDHEGDEHNTTV